MNSLTVTILVAVLGSTAVSQFLIYIITRHDNKDNMEKRVKDLEEMAVLNGKSIIQLKDANKVVIGNSIFKTGSDYLSRGDYITPNELKNLEMLYEVYSKLNGNSYAADIMDQIRKLNIRY